MAFTEDLIDDIPEQQVKFFGGTGKKLMPSRATVENLIRRIPVHRLMTTDEFRAELAAQFGVRGTCPVTTRKILLEIAQDSTSDLAYWRIINQNGDLVGRYPGGIEAHAAHLQQEGFTIARGKTLKVSEFRSNLIRFRD